MKGRRRPSLVAGLHAAGGGAILSGAEICDELRRCEGDLRFRDREALEEWLQTQPRAVSVVIAARAALRVLPVTEQLVAGGSPGGALKLREIISGSFRVGGLARVASKFSLNANEFVIHAAVNYAADASKFAPAAEANAASAASHAAHALLTGANAPMDASVAADAAALAAFAAGRAPSASWAAVSNDANFLSQGGAVTELADRTLWPDATPPWAYELWVKITAALPSGEGWAVWTRWYDERLIGAPSRGEAYELVFATVPEEVWKEGYAAANRWIKEHLPPEPQPQPDELPSIESLPAQIAAAAQFSEGGAGPIDIARDPARSDPSEVEDQREHYSEARRKALDLHALGGNLLGDDLRRRVARLLEVMPADMDEMSIVKLWHRANSLRERLADHDQAVQRQKPGDDPDPAILAYAAAGPLRDFVKSYNIFIIGDARGRELDRKSLGPGERERDQAAIAAMEPVIAALPSEPEVATEAVPEILQELSDAAKAAPKTLAGDQDVALARDSLWNLILAAIRKAYRGMNDEPAVAWKGAREGAYRYVGGKIADAALTGCGSAIGIFIAQHADALKLFASQVYPSIIQIIDAIANLLNKHI